MNRAIFLSLFFASFVALTGGALYAPSAFGKIRVVTTLTDLKSITAEVGGYFVDVDSIVKGTQDPHYIEAKPSYMSRMSRADLVISAGLDLESAWLPSIIRGARNPKLALGAAGNLEVGPLVEPIDVLEGTLSRRDGDIHPKGNPHVTLDPERAGKIAVLVGNKLADLDPEHAAYFKERAEKLQSRLGEKSKLWQKRIQDSGVTSVVTYHKTLTYFTQRFRLKTLAMLEPKPGIPPTSGHIISVIELLKKEPTPVVLIENFFDPSVIKKIKPEVPKLRSAHVAVAVEGSPQIKTIDDLYESLVAQIEGKK